MAVNEATPAGLVLSPGSYLIELHLGGGQTTTPDELRRALETCGFDSVIADEPGTVPVPPVVGAAMLAPSPIAKPAGPSPASPISRLSSPLSLSSNFGPAIAPKETNSPTRGAPSAFSKVGPLGGAARLAQARTATQAQTPIKTTPPKKGRGLLGSGGGDGGGGDGGSQEAAGPDFAVDASDDRYATDQTTGKRYYLDPDTGTIYEVDPASGELLPIDQNTLAPLAASGRLPAPPPAAPAPAGQSDDPLVSLLERGGGEHPFGEDPSFSLHVGAAGPEDPVYRVVARTPGRIVLRASDALSWGARRLAVDPYGDVPVKVRPFILTPGETYDMVVLSRDRKARSRGDVWTLAEAMGFEPHAISLLQRDVHLPKRYASSYSRWVLVGTWAGPSTIVTAEEPLLFADVARSTGTS